MISAYVVQAGDHLWGISSQPKVYGDPYQWPLLFKRNRADITDADLIYPGQMIQIERDMSDAQIQEAIDHARSRGAWALGVVEGSDLRYLQAAGSTDAANATAEQAAAMMADSYSRLGPNFSCTMVTSGPGATNLITGIADALIDSTPIVCITGQVASHLLGTDAFQETDIIGISTPATKWSYQITKANEIPYVMAKAFYIARSGRPGPVLIDITKDAQFESFDFEYKKCLGIRLSLIHI